MQSIMSAEAGERWPELLVLKLKTGSGSAASPELLRVSSELTGSFSQAETKDLLNSAQAGSAQAGKLKDAEATCSLLSSPQPLDSRNLFSVG
jgi:hypothetical protein